MLNLKKYQINYTLLKPCCYFTCNACCIWMGVYLTLNNKIFTKNGKNNQRWLFFHYWQIFSMRDQLILIKNSIFTHIWFEDNFICRVLCNLIWICCYIQFLVIICKLKISAKFCKEPFHISKLNTSTSKYALRIAWVNNFWPILREMLMIGWQIVFWGVETAHETKRFSF